MSASYTFIHKWDVLVSRDNKYFVWGNSDFLFLCLCRGIVSFQVYDLFGHHLLKIFNYQILIRNIHSCRISTDAYIVNFFSPVHTSLSHLSKSLLRKLCIGCFYWTRCTKVAIILADFSLRVSALINPF